MATAYVHETHKSFLKEPGSAITHFIGVIMSGFGIVPLLSRAGQNPDSKAIFSSTIFIVSMFLLYSASTLYHSVRTKDNITLILKKLDHIMIYVLIAGTYTPICILALPKGFGLPLLGLIWGMTLAGIFLTTVWVTSPKWLNSTIYITMGWACVLAFKPLLATLSTEAFLWLLTGGIIYTIGGIVYALKLPIFNSIHKNFGSHEIFHLFVLAGSICHYIMIYAYLV